MSQYKSTNTTTINRVNKDRNYTTINNTCLRDTRLSWKAKGIMAYMLTLPDTWVINIGEVIKHSPDGEKGFRSGLKELKEHGYVIRVQIREGNRIVGWHTEINEIPTDFNEDNQVKFDISLDAEKLHVQKLHVQKLHVQKDALLSTKDINNLKELNTEYNIKDNVTSVPLPVSKEEDKYPFKEVIDYLNKSANKGFKYVASHKKHIVARFKEGFTLEDFKKVIEVKTHQWLNDPKLNTYLRPETLFGNKMDGYLQEYYKPNNGQKKYQQPTQQVTSKEVIGTDDINHPNYNWGNYRP